MKVDELLKMGAELNDSRLRREMVSYMDSEVIEYCIVKASDTVLMSSFIFEGKERHIGVLNGWIKPLSEVHTAIKSSHTHRKLSDNAELKRQMLFEKI